jgi:2'-5' RNA ligase
MEVALRANGFRFDARDYVPHITLLRNAVQAPRLLQLTPIVWHARQFALVESVRDDGGSRYRVLESWALRPEREPTAYNRDSGPAGPDENDG